MVATIFPADEDTKMPAKHRYTAVYSDRAGGVEGFYVHVIGVELEDKPHGVTFWKRYDRREDAEELATDVDQQIAAIVEAEFAYAHKAHPFPDVEASIDLEMARHYAELSKLHKRRARVLKESARKRRAK